MMGIIICVEILSISLFMSCMKNATTAVRRNAFVENDIPHDLNCGISFTVQQCKSRN
jgi:hypothetical protein